MRKRILSLGLALVMLLSLLPGTVWAVEPKTESYSVVVEDLGSVNSVVQPSGNSLLNLQPGAGFSWANGRGYYNQLDNDSKKIYDAILASGLASGYQAKTEITYTGALDSSALGDLMTPALLAVTYDNPKLSWLSGVSYRFSGTGSGSGWTLTVTIPEHQTVDKSGTVDFGGISKINGVIDAAKSEIDSQLTDGTASRYETVRAIHDYVCNKVTYVTEGESLEPSFYQTVYSAFFTDSGAETGAVTVCAGYSKAFKALCDAYGIPCVLVSGTGNGGAHMWNYVQMEDGLWYAVDCTWDDQKSKIYYDFFLVGSETVATNFQNKPFGESHKESGNWSSSGKYVFAYPGLATDKYTPKAPIEGKVSITGEAKINATLEADISGITAPSTDGSFTYQWYRGDEAISGATEKTYTPKTAEDVDKTIKVAVKAEGYSGQLEASTTTPVAKADVAAPSAPEATATYNSITITNPDDRYEYACTEYQDVELSWQTGSIFFDRAWSTTYYVYARVKETETHNASAASVPLKITTKAIPISVVTVEVDAPAKGVELDTEAVVSVSDRGVSANVEWYKGAAVAGEPVTGPADANQVYTVKITLTAGDDPSFDNYVEVTLNSDAPQEVRPDESGSLVITKTFPATEEKMIDKLEVTTQPAKIEYAEGEDFDPTGMVVKAFYDDGTTNDNFTAYTIEGGQNLTKETKFVTVKVGSVSTTVAITVKGALKESDFTYAPPSDLAYDGTAKTAAVGYAGGITEAEAGTITVSYDPSNPTNAGTYTVYVTTAGGTKYAPVSEPIQVGTFTIAKGNQAPLTITSTGPATYGETYTLETTGGTTSGTVTYSVTDGTGSATISGNTLTPTKAGEVTVTAAMAGNENYEPVTSASVTITINKAQATYVMTSASSTIVAGKSSSVTLPALPDGASYGEPSTTSTSEVTGLAIADGVLTYTGGESVVEDARYTVTIPVAESTNYLAYEITVTLTGSDRLTPTLTVNPIVVTYTGSQVPASVITGIAKVGDTVVPGTWSWNSAAVPPTNVNDSGIYDVCFTPTDSDTYAAAYGKVQVTINKAVPTGGPKYTAINTSGKTLADAGLTTVGGTFSVPGTVAWELASTTQVQANTYYKWIFTPDSDNYAQLTGSIQLWRRTSSGGGSSSGGSNSSGNQTEITKNPDGSTTTTVTKPDGTVTTTTTDKNGNKTQTVEKPNGTVITTVDKKDGSSSTTTISASGVVKSTVDLSKSAVNSATSQGQAVALPMPEVAASSSWYDAPTVTVNLPVGGSTKVEIPVEDVTTGTVAILVKADGSEQVIKTSLVTDNGVAVTLGDGDTVKIVDNSKSFYDVSRYYWGADAIDFATSRQIFSGTSSTTFSPDMAMNRAMIVTVLAAYEGVDTTSSGAWYETSRQWAMKQGISDGTNMEQTLTREQLATMLWRYAGSPSAGSLSGYPDAGSVSSYAVQAMAWAVENGLISGMDGNLAPQGQATRAQVATILMRFVESQNA